MQKKDEYLPLMTQIFGVEKEQMRTWLCNRKIVTAQESVVKPLTIQQVNHPYKPSIIQQVTTPKHCTTTGNNFLTNPSPHNR